MVTDVGPPRENKWSATVPGSVEGVEVVERPQRIESIHLVRFAPLLPVDPPEVDPVLVLERVYDVFEIPAKEFGIRGIEFDWLASVRVDPHVFSHRPVLGLVGVDPFCGVEIERRLQTRVVEPVDEPLGVGEQFAVPGPARPAVVVGVADDVPVHIDDTDRQREPLLAEGRHDVLQFLLGVVPVAAPPVAQRPPGYHRHVAGDLGVGPECAQVVVAEAEEVDVLVVLVAVPGGDPPVVVEDEAVGVLEHGPAVPGEQAVLEIGLAVDAVQRPGRPAEVVGIVAVAVGLVEPRQGDRQRLGSEPPADVVAQVEVFGVDLQAAVDPRHLEVRDREIPVPHGLARAVLELAVRVVLQAQEPGRQYGKPAVLGRNGRVVGRDRVELGYVIVGESHCSRIYRRAA